MEAYREEQYLLKCNCGGDAYFMQIDDIKAYIKCHTCGTDVVYWGPPSLAVEQLVNLWVGGYGFLEKTGTDER